MAISNPKIDRISLMRVPGDEHWPDMFVVKAFMEAKHDLDIEAGAPANFEICCRIAVNSGDEPLLAVEKRAADAVRATLRTLAEAT